MVERPALKFSVIHHQDALLRRIKHRPLGLYGLRRLVENDPIHHRRHTDKRRRRAVRRFPDAWSGP